MSNEKPDLIERDAVLRMLKAITSHSSQPGWGYAEQAIMNIPATTVSGTKPSIDWSHVAPDFNWMSFDQDGDTYLFDKRPEVGHTIWSNPSSGEYKNITGAFASYTPGTCDWKDSLVMRPGYKGE